MTADIVILYVHMWDTIPVVAFGVDGKYLFYMLITMTVLLVRDKYCRYCH